MIKFYYKINFSFNTMSNNFNLENGNQTSYNDKTVATVLVVFLIVLVFYLLQQLASILMPLVLAFLFASLFQPIILFLKKKNFPNWLIVPIIAIITITIIAAFALIIAQSVSQIIEQKDVFIDLLNQKIDISIKWLNSISRKYFNFRINDKKILALFDKDFISNTVSSLAASLGSFLSSFFMFILYYIILLTSMSNYKSFLSWVGGSNSKLLQNYEHIQKAIVSYITIKTLLNLTTGTLATIIFYSFDLQFPLFWGFLTFLLFYIPSIGSIIAPIPPLLMGIIQFDSFNTILMMMLLIMFMQAIMGNIIEPILMGQKLRLNTLTIIFGIVFWSYIWGVTGMFLCVPLLVMFKLILEQYPTLEFISRLMGTAPKQ
ncbi:MAG TPA: AI-2E family transporter [Candidatus Kapabacteria bacterium]|nr:AI-2E family transporter [Candidatus Kapabacteria bacterium]